MFARLLYEIEMRIKGLLFLLGLAICEKQGCWSRETMPCYIYNIETEEEETDYYCYTHVSDMGYCWGCGQFWAGCEDFDFSPNRLCSNCREELEDVDNDYDEEEEYDLCFGEP